jgi:DNA-binding SARP family transcriptional activator/tetratricopeptide (TPR) repeat protein
MLWLLGPLRLVLGGQRIDLGPGKQQCVLAVLAMSAGQTVPVSGLVDRVWDERPPSLSNPVASHVCRLRRLLAVGEESAQHVPDHDSHLAIRYIAGGYRLECDPELIDVHRARRLASAGRAAVVAGEDAAAVDLFDRALVDWGLVALPGLQGRWAAQVREMLAAERLDLVAERAVSQVRLGRHADVVEQLVPLTVEYPSAERLTLPLMTALVATGRSTEALRSYARTRAALADELGSEPSSPLQALHLRILRENVISPATPSLQIEQIECGSDLTEPVDGRTGAHGHQGGRPSSETPQADAPTRVDETSGLIPAQLPPVASVFVGRKAELHALDDLVSSIDASAGTTTPATERPPLRVVVISGTAGVGKSALALHWAHLNSHLYPHGQLYLNMRGHGPEDPMPPPEGLDRLLDGLGVTAPEIPVAVDAKAARFRTATCGRRLLIMLDNVSSADQVRALLPGAGPCTVLVTSRDTLSGLVAVDGAHRLHLDLLPDQDAFELLRALIGDRVEAERGATRELARRCARLPLALRVAAELVACRSDATLREAVSELEDEDGNTSLEALNAGGDVRADVQAVFSWSLRQLSSEVVTVFCYLGLHPGPDADSYAAAAVSGCAPEQAREALTRLARAHLVQRKPGDRYGMHDLLRAYAAGLARQRETGCTRGGGPSPTAEGCDSAAMIRLVGYYLHVAVAAMNALHPGEAHRRPSIGAPSVSRPRFEDAEQARDWLDAERACLVALARRAATRGQAICAVHLSNILFRYLAGGHHAEALAIHGHARDAARRSGDDRGHAQALVALGGTHMTLGRYSTAAAYLETAIHMARAAGDPTTEARALDNLGSVNLGRTNYRVAARQHRRALDLFGEAGDRVGQARALTSLGAAEDRMRHRVAAVEHHHQALRLYCELQDAAGEAHVLSHLGDMEQRLGHYEAAAKRHREALRLHRQLGNRSGQAWELDDLGIDLTGLGLHEQATAHHAEALAVFRDIGELEGQTHALNGLGEAAQSAGRPADALQHHAEALSLTQHWSLREQQARAHAGVARAQRALGRLATARAHFQQVVALREEFELPVDEIHSEMAALDNDSSTADG